MPAPKCSFANVGGLNEVLVMAISCTGAPQRRLERVESWANQQSEIAGFGLYFMDVLYAQTTDAASVDYVVSIAAPDVQ